MIERLLLNHFLFDIEWKQQSAAPGSPFESVIGLGSIVYTCTRSYIPSLLTFLTLALPEFIGAYMFLELGGILAWILSAVFTLIALNTIISIWRSWPGRTPMKIALFSGGIAWIDQDRIHQLAWNQITAAHTASGFIIETRSGSPVAFEASLKRRAFGLAIERALKGAPPGVDADIQFVPCPHCASLISKDVDYCVYCANPVDWQSPQASLLHCPNCGAQSASPSDCFCRACGKEIVRA